MANEYHRLYTEEFEDAEAEAGGAIIGWCAAHGEPGIRWTPVLREAFRHAVAAAFDAGYAAAVKHEVA